MLPATNPIQALSSMFAFYHIPSPKGEEHPLRTALSRARVVRVGISALLLVRTPRFLPVSGISSTTPSGWITRFRAR